MRKMLVVSMREYVASVKTKAFIATIVLMPIIMGAGGVIQYVTRNKVDTNDKRVAILDHTGVIYDAVTRAADERNTEHIFDGEGDERRQVRPRFIITRAEVSSEDPSKTELALSDQVRSGDLFAYVVVGPNVVEPDEAAEGDTKSVTVRYHSNNPLYETFRRWIARPINDQVHQIRFASAGLDPEVVDKATKWTGVEQLGLVSLDEAGHITEAQKTNEAANMLVPISMMMLLFMSIMVGAAPLMQSVLEEKMQRIAEVLLASIPPFQLMMGKLIGMVGVSLTIATVYLVGGFIAVTAAGYGQFFPTHLVWWFVLYQALAVLMFGSLFAAVGAAVTDLKESQAMMTPVMVVAMSPMFVWLPVLKEPTSTFSTMLSFIPPMTPMLMLVRQAVPPGIPVWQPILGAALVLLSTIACVFAAGRVFRVGILMQGKGAKVGEMLRWVVKG